MWAYNWPHTCIRDWHSHNGLYRSNSQPGDEHFSIEGCLSREHSNRNLAPAGQNRALADEVLSMSGIGEVKEPLPSSL